jgi:hypothetical protein
MEFFPVGLAMFPLFGAFATVLQSSGLCVFCLLLRTLFYSQQ